MKQKTVVFFLLCLLFGVPMMAYANVVWPSLYIAERMLTWYIIGAGLLVEIIFCKYFVKTTWGRAAWMAFLMNLVSTVAGIFLIPISGFLGVLLLAPLDLPTFDVWIWLLSYVLAILCNVWIEGGALRLVFHLPFKKNFWWLCGANTLSVLLCILVYGFEFIN